MTDGEERRQPADLDLLRQAVRETVNGRLDRLSDSWDKQHEQHQEYCRREREVLHERVDAGDAAFTKFLEEEWKPVKSTVLDTMAFLRLSAKAIGGFVGLAAITIGVLSAVGVL